MDNGWVSDLDVGAVAWHRYVEGAQLAIGRQSQRVVEGGDGVG